MINSLASYARINEYGFIEAPYRKIDKTDPSNPIVTDDVVYMTADEEDNYHVAQANEPLDEEGHFLHKNVSGRFREETQEYEKRMFDYMDVSPKMVFSESTAAFVSIPVPTTGASVVRSRTGYRRWSVYCKW